MHRYKFSLFIKGVIIVCLLVCGSFQPGIAQITVDGTICGITPGNSYTYTLSASSMGETNTICVNGGTLFAYNNSVTNGCMTDNPLWTFDVVWDGSGNYSLSVSNSLGSVTVNPTTYVPPLDGGTISGQQLELSVKYNSVPVPINCSVASGGYCSPNYQYQWLESFDNSSWSDMSGQTAPDLVFDQPLTRNKYFRRKVTEASSGSVTYSPVATRTIESVYITPALIKVNYNTTPGVLYLTNIIIPATPTFTIQWQSSTDNSNWTNINGATIYIYTPGNVTTTIWFRAALTANGITSYSTVSQVYLAVTGGSIAASTQVIATGGNATLTNVQEAANGSCAGSYTYQWQRSVDENTWVDIAGPNLTNITQSAFYRRKVTCGGDVAFSNTVRIKLKHTGIANVPDASTTTGTASVIPMPGYNADPNNMNYIKNREFVKPGIVDLATADGITDNNEVRQAASYFDGLGRSIQSVSKGITPAGSDMIGTNFYDDFGREVQKYLPYTDNTSTGNFRLDATVQQPAFYNHFFNNTEAYYYSANTYELSELNRLVKTTAPGKSWTGSNTGTLQLERSNTANDDVQVWIIGAGLPPVNAGAYPEGVLYVHETTDEHFNKVIEYKDLQGKVILKKVEIEDAISFGHTGWLCTYYVYDDLDQLRIVIPPKAVTQIRALNWQFTDDIMNELCFKYDYDSRQRMIAKKVPGAGWVYMVYDVRDRLVFTQDANMRNNNNQWMTTLYDGLNRPVMTGIMTGYTGTPFDLQQSVTTQTKNLTILPSGLLSDLTLPLSGQPVPISGTFQAYNTITLDPGFESGVDFTAEIVSGTGSGGNEEVTIENLIVNRSPIPSGTTFIALTKTFYDNYKWTNAAYTSAYNSYLEQENLNPYPVVMPATEDYQTTGLVTGSQVRVLQDPANLSAGSWLTSVSFYDDRNRVLQVNSENHRGGRDILTNRYDFSGRMITSYLDHTNPGGTPASVHMKNDNKYDHAGRLLEVWNTIDDNGNNKVLIAKYEYNELGQLKDKKLGRKKDLNGNYTVTPIETLDYNYNIRGWVTGINKDYVNNPGNSAKWFGLELNYDQGFQINQLNGNIAGTKWRSRGDGERRAYGYSYDNANRLMVGDFTQHDGAGYVNNSVVNFDMQMGDGQTVSSAYDENGNIIAMKQWGLKLNNSPVIDDLHYTYHKGGNKLKLVEDYILPQTGARLGDFQDNNTGNDYGYDANGNMIVDKNKKLNGVADVDQVNGAIVYNHLNLPWKILVEGGNKGSITYTYDAAGVKLNKVVVDKSVAGKTITTTTSYVGGLVYESKATNPADPTTDYADKLQLVNHEEGRIRYMSAGNNVAAHFEYDYFVKDHLGNVRVVLTEEIVSHDYIATMEKGADNKLRNDENQLFSNLDASEYPTVNVPGGYPSGYSAIEPNDYVAMVNGTTSKKGPAIVLKVMAGDVVDLRVKYFYRDNANPGGIVNAVNDILSSLAGGIVNASGGVKGTLAELSDPGSPLVGALNAFRNDNNPDNSGKPKAYLNWILLDEQFKYVSTQSGALPVNQANQVLPLHQPDMTISKNGYLYIYVSNETEFWNVFFDDLAVTHRPGALLEETHYYPFGLTMTGISSKVLGVTENKRKYNGIENENSFDINLGETFYRTHDPQLGRWWQIDPKLEMSQNISPYAAMDNNPVIKVDPMGDIAVVDDAVIGFFRGLFAKRKYFDDPNSTRLGNAFGSAGRHANNSARLWGGLFTSDKHRSLLGQVGQIASRFTWQLPNTIVGFVTSHIVNMIGQVDWVNYAFGATVMNVRNSDFGGITLGSFVIGDASIEASEKNALFQHEFGHTLQSEIWGPGYLFGIGIPSLISAKRHTYWQHMHYYSEIGASTRSHNYFYNRLLGFNNWDYESNPVKESSERKAQNLDWLNRHGTGKHDSRYPGPGIKMQYYWATDSYNKK